MNSSALLFCGLFTLACYLLSISMTSFLQGINNSLQILVLTSILISLYILSPKPDISFGWWVMVILICSVCICSIGGLLGFPDAWLTCIAAASLIVAVITLLELKLGQYLHDLLAARITVFTLFLCCLSAPLWMSPLCLLFPQTPAIVDISIAVSPLSYLAVLMESDYLRSDWFYRNTVYGGLRYHYPSIYSYLQVQAILLTLLYFIKKPVLNRAQASN